MDALLLLGPTGVGKSPLGERCEAEGLAGRRCLHFDFGMALRRAAADPAAVPTLGAAEHAVVRRVLREGTLLEDAQWPIAETLLRAFLDARAARAEDLLVLDGLPRHVGQAAAIDALHRVRALCVLEASPETLRARIRHDTGGDRAGRADDTPAAIAGRLARFRARTRPLLAHYRALPQCRVTAGVETTPAEAYGHLRTRLADVLAERA